MGCLRCHAGLERASDPPQLPAHMLMEADDKARTHTLRQLASTLTHARAAQLQISAPLLANEVRLSAFISARSDIFCFYLSL